MRHPRPGSEGSKVHYATRYGNFIGKQSGIGRETHRVMLDHYQQTKNILVSYDQKPMGLY